MNNKPEMRIFPSSLTYMDASVRIWIDLFHQIDSDSNFYVVHDNGIIRRIPIVLGKTGR